MIVRCRTCGKTITKYSGHIGLAERMKRIRDHYKKFHPHRFKRIISKSLATKKAKGIIKSHHSHIVKFKTKSGKIVKFEVK